MIATLQKHNTFLVVVLAVTVFAFVGAGFVGWGSYDFSTGATNVAKVGDEEVSRTSLSLEYGRLYSLYSQFSDQPLGEQMERQIQNVALNSLIEEALLVAYARDLGLSVSKSEISEMIIGDPSFHVNGVFDKKLYVAALMNSRQDIKSFESRLERQLLVTKLQSMLLLPITNSEKNALAAPVFGQDKLTYKIITAPAKIAISEDEAKAYYEANRDRFIGEPSFDISYLIAASTDQNVTSEEIQSYYDRNIGEFLTDAGEIRALDDVKSQAENSAKLAKARRKALILKNSWNKGEIEPKSAKSVEFTNNILPREVMIVVESLVSADISDPISYDGGYVVAKTTDRKDAEPLPFEKARSAVQDELKTEKTKNFIRSEAEKQLKSFRGLTTDFVSRSDTDKIRGLNSSEGSVFLNQVFASIGAEGIVEFDDKAVIYRILEQKLFNEKDGVTINDAHTESVLRLKASQTRQGLLSSLQNRYQITLY